jgi:hypothetical protein
VTYTITDIEGHERELSQADTLDEFTVSSPDDAIRRAVLRERPGRWRVDRKPAEPYPTLPLGHVVQTEDGEFRPLPYGHREGLLPAPRNSLIEAVVALT